ncbi:L-threonylcarbamoyladenylate synthase [uncultured Marinobacter sp.]|uniref:L-threonylcarbamoyladenylate synthase n=1 Tax=uncultured Marinobacter sp. TaxID=187379 RepID=UPI0030D97EBD|tara:strand:+ start:398 stop:1102 length:705 start_codon:yes stop_codon:yes gene_type:complete
MINSDKRIKKLDLNTIKEAARILDQGGLVVLPSDTNYCIHCDYKNPNAVKRLYDTKKRSGNSPLLMTVPDASYISSLAEPNDHALKLVSQYWPAPFSVILLRKPKVPDFVVRGLQTVGLGCHKHPALKMLFRLRPDALASSSANVSGGPDPKSADEVAKQIALGVDLIVDGGHLDSRHANTLIDFSEYPPVVARSGEFPLELVRQIIPDINDTVTNEQYKTRTQGQVSKVWGAI